jgi:hypothetical protein
MPNEKLSIPLSDLDFPAPVEGIDLHNKDDDQLKSNYINCAGGMVYQVTDTEYERIQGCLVDYAGRMQIDGADIIYTSPKNQQGVTSVPPY